MTSIRKIKKIIRKQKVVQGKRDMEFVTPIRMRVLGYFSIFYTKAKTPADAIYLVKETMENARFRNRCKRNPKMRAYYLVPKKHY